MAAPRSLSLSVIFSAIDRFTGPLNQINARIRAVTAPARAAQNAIASVSQAAGVSRLAGAFSDVRKEVGSVVGGIETGFRRAAYVIASATGAVYLFKREFLDTASFFENLEIQLEGVFDGSAARAREAMSFIRRTAFETPFESPELAKAFRTMLGFGLDPMRGALRSIADQVAKIGGSGDDLTGVAMQLGQAWSKGRLQAQDANILVERGIPVWGLLARAVERVTQRQVSIGQLRKMSEDGQIGLKGLNLLIEQMGIESASAAKRMMTSFAGLWSQLREHWIDFKRRVMDTGAFDALKARLRRVVDTLNTMAADGRLQQWAELIGRALLTAFEWLREYGPSVLGSVVDAIKVVAWWADKAQRVFGGWGNLVTFGLAAYIGGPLVMAVLSLMGAVISLGAAIGFTPVGWLLAGFALLAVAAAGYWQNWEQIGAGFVDLFGGLRDVFGGFVDYVTGVSADRLLSGVTRVFQRVKDAARFAFPGMAWVWDQTVGRLGAAGPAALPSTNAAEPPSRLQSLIAATPPIVPAASQSGRLLVEFKGAPRGTRVSADARGDWLDMSVGYAIPEIP